MAKHFDFYINGHASDDIQCLIDDLDKKGLLEPGEYTITMMIEEDETMTINLGGKEYEALACWELTAREKSKAEWVEETLSDFLISLNTGITGTDYINIDHEVEIVRVHYEGGGMRDVNVTMDSKAAIVEDIYKQGAIY